MRHLGRVPQLVVVHACVGLFVLSWLGGQPVSDFSRGSGWQRWLWFGTNSVLEETDVSSGLVIGGRFDGLMRWSTSYEVIPHEKREAYEQFKQLPRIGPAPEVVAMPEWVLRSAESGFTGGIRGGIGFMIAVWSWDSRTTIPMSERSWGYPESGVARIAGMPLAVRPAFPGFLIAWAFTGLLSFGVTAGFVGAARRLKRSSMRREGCCERCGYDLTGVAIGVCPECGATRA